MREYSKAEPKMWHGATMKALRKRGFEGVIVALYLMTSPSSNMLGLFSQPVLYMAHETGLGFEGASKGLRDCIEVGFCSYDEESEMVWVHEMARYQIAPSLKASDLRCKGVQREYEGLPDNPFLGPFFDRYGQAFHLTERRAPEDKSEASAEAPSKPLTKPLRSQEQEQEQEQEHPPTPQGEWLVGFAEFWSAWPRSQRKGGKGECEKVWRQHRLTQHSAAILAHVTAMAKSEGWTKQGGAFVPAPVVYLRGKRWDGAELGAAREQAGPDIFEGAI